MITGCLVVGCIFCFCWKRQLDRRLSNLVIVLIYYVFCLFLSIFYSIPYTVYRIQYTVTVYLFRVHAFFVEIFKMNGKKGIPGVYVFRLDKSQFSLIDFLGSPFFSDLLGRWSILKDHFLVQMVVLENIFYSIFFTICNLWWINL